MFKQYEDSDESRCHTSFNKGVFWYHLQMLPKLQQVTFLRCVGSRGLTLVMWFEDQILMAVR